MQAIYTVLLLSIIAQALSIPGGPSASLLAIARKSGPIKVAALDTRACKIPDYNPGPVSVSLPDFDANKAQVYRYRKQQAVNLGSWFVHEAWMVPSVFTCAAGKQDSEIDLASGWEGVENAKKVLEKHWDTFITEDDFKYLAKIGINTVRLPLGFWSLGTNFTKGSVFEKYGDAYENSWPRVLRAIGWAGENGIGVLADLHGAYGSQNGQSHSGISDGKTNLFSNQKDQDMTINALVWMTQQFVKVTNVVGIQILNEPQNEDNLPDFYNSAIEAMRKVDGAEKFPLYLHDGFNIDQYSQWVGDRDDFSVVDHHSYFVYTDSDTSKPVTSLTSMIKSDVSFSISSNAKIARGNLVTDEWGCALAESSTQGVSNLDSATQAYCQGQETVYRNAAAGYAFWSYTMDDCKAGDGNGWCFKGSVANILPKTFFSYEAQTEPVDGIAVDGTTNSTASSSSSSNDDTNSDDNATPSSSSSSPSSTSATDNQGSNSSGQSCKASKKRVTSSSTSNNARRRHHARNPAPHPHLSSPQQPSKRASDSSQGYRDGLAAAKKFAKMGGSKLGFTLQFIKDTAGDKATDSYIEDFVNGVKDGEGQVDKALRRRRK
ncbi:Glucan 1,3-beta-glucosidase 3 [Tulasnella sp. 408]|nr:Glucan 1,3-beta-glucosidase 3 [Tulasnella sp. 408]